MAKYLDSNGISTLWNRIKSTFLTQGGGDERYSPKSHSHSTITSLGNYTPTTSDNRSNYGIYTYNIYKGTPQFYMSVIGFGYSTSKVEISGSWGDDYAGHLYWRSKSDRSLTDYPWKNWVEILDTNNYSSYAASANHTHSYLPLSGGTLSGNLSIVTSGESALTLGSTTSGISGSIYLYATGSRYTKLVTAATGASHTITFPNADGTVSLEGHTHSYLPLSGGNITGTLDVSSNFNARTIYQNGVALGSNAFSSTAYLPLSGGTMSGAIVPNSNSTINFGSATAKWHYVYAHRILNVQTICNSTTYSENMLTLPSKSGTIAVTSDLSAYLPLAGGTMNNTNLVTNLNADTVDGYHASGFFRNLGLNPSGITYGSDISTQGVCTLDVGQPDGPANSYNTTWLTLGEYSLPRFKQLAFSYDTDTIGYRRNSGNGWTSWRIFAFLDSNVASATNADTVDGYHYNNLPYLPLSGGTMTGNITMGANSIVFNQSTTSNWNVAANTGVMILNTVGAAATGAPGTYYIGLSVSGYYGFQLATYGGGGTRLLFRNTSRESYPSWTELAFLSDLSWGNISGKPSTFTPSSHTHDYLPLSGGNLTGNIRANSYFAFSDDPTGYDYGGLYRNSQITSGGEASRVWLYSYNDIAICGKNVDISNHSSGSVTINGYTPWTNGNFNPSNYSTTSHDHDGRYIRRYTTNQAHTYSNIDDIIYGESTIDGNTAGTTAYSWADWNTTLLTLGCVGTRTKQLIFNYSKDDIYYRRYVDSGWTSMRTIAFTDQLPSSLSNSEIDTIIQ